MDFLRNCRYTYSRLRFRCMRYLLFLFYISLNFDFYGMYDSFSVTTEKTNVPTNNPLQNKSREEKDFYFFFFFFFFFFTTPTYVYFSVQYAFTFNFLHVQQCKKTCHLIVLSAINRLNVDRINR